MFSASLLDHDLHWSGLYCASILLMAISLQAMFTILKHLSTITFIVRVLVLNILLS